MEGEDSDSSKRGLTRRILELLFEKILNLSSENKTYLNLSIIQIHNEIVYDLLSEDAGAVKFRLNKEGIPYIDN